jgi:hypothetical protein
VTINVREKPFSKKTADAAAMISFHLASSLGENK